MVQQRVLRLLHADFVLFAAVDSHNAVRGESFQVETREVVLALGAIEKGLVGGSFGHSRCCGRALWARLLLGVLRLAMTLACGLILGPGCVSR